MKQKPTVFLIVLIAFLCGVAILSFAKKDNSLKSIDGAGKAPDVLPRRSGNARDVARITREFIAEMKATNVTFKFFGEIIDQHGAPVPGMQVLYEVRSFDETERNGEMRVKGKVESDSTGRFSITGRKGHSFSILMINKSGYEVQGSGLPRSFVLALPRTDKGESFRPDSNQPVAFNVWRLQGPEALVSFYHEAKIPTDGTPYLTPIIGPLKTRFSVTFNSDRGQRSKLYDWSFTAKLENSGIVVGNDDFGFLAPDSGYLDELRVQMLASNPGWRTDASVKAFLRTETGTYGQVAVTIGAPIYSNGPSAIVYIQGNVNHSGSRNLEPGGKSP